MQTSADETTPAPNLHVLSYVTRIDSPSNACRVAARATLILGILCAIIAIPATLHIGNQIYQMAHTLATPWWFAVPGVAAPPPMPPWYSPTIVMQSIQFVLERTGPPIYVLPLVQLGMFLPILARGVRRGRAFSSVTAGLWFAAAGLAVLLATAAVCIWAIFNTAFANAVDGADFSALLLGLVGLPIGVALTLLCKDLTALLFWLPRNRGLEKPRVPFLPGQSSQQTAAAELPHLQSTKEP